MASLRHSDTATSGGGFRDGRDAEPGAGNSLGVAIEKLSDWTAKIRRLAVLGRAVFDLVAWVKDGRRDHRWRR